MCTRFYIEPRSEELDEIMEAAMKTGLARKFLIAGSAVLTSGEIRPTNVVPVIAPNKDGKRTVFPMRWGFRIPGRSLVVNARTETAAVRPTFRDSWRQHRCVIPASWYFEWEHLDAPGGKTKTGDKFAIQPNGQSVTWLCGLYRIEDGFPAFTVLTREPSDDVRRIHDRMPLILPEEMTDAWISPEQKPEDIIGYAVTDLVMERVSAEE
ncbi:MAG: SOS response-associated peptidase [Oscillospiraceae bacterium]|nr:SOS response-associated peptidase [Oscillospiraceae bacterium]